MHGMLCDWKNTFTNISEQVLQIAFQHYPHVLNLFLGVAFLNLVFMHREFP